MKIDSNNEYKKYFDKISPDNRLIEDTKKKMMEELNSTVYKEKKNIVVYRRIAAAAACLAIVGSAVVMVPKLKNVPVSTKNNSTIQIEQSDMTCVTSSPESEKSSSTSVCSKVKESNTNNSLTKELTVTTAESNISKSAVVVSTVETSVNNNKALAADVKETRKENTSISSEKSVKQTEAVSVSENIVSTNASEIVISEETKQKDPKESNQEYHIIGDGDRNGDSKTDNVPDSTGSQKIISRQIGDTEYTINLITSAYLCGHVSGNVKAESKYFKKSTDKEKGISVINELVSKNEFDLTDTVPLNFIMNNDIEEISMEYTSNDIIYEFNPLNSGAGEEKFISFAVSKNTEVGYIMKSAGELCTTDLYGIDNSIFSKNNNDGIYLGYVPSDKCYCAAFDINGFKYRILFKGFEFEDVINYIQPFVLTITEK